MARIQSHRAVKEIWPNQLSHSISIIDLDTGELLGLQGLPQELDYQAESTWATLKIPGRNAPRYHFTGAEDTLVLEISWYSEQEDCKDVILKCKWLESMSKADGFKGRPHLAALSWGNLFAKATWIVASAPYKLFTFDGTKGFLPRHARQTVTLKRHIIDNTTIDQIYDYQT